MNSLFGVMMTRVQNFKDFKIVTTEEQVDKLTIKPNFITRNNINKNLSIVEMGKNISNVYISKFNRFNHFTKFESSYV